MPPSLKIKGHTNNTTLSVQLVLTEQNCGPEESRQPHRRVTWRVPERAARSWLWEEPVGNRTPSAWNAARCGARLSTGVMNCRSVWRPATLTVSFFRGSSAGRRKRSPSTPKNPVIHTQVQVIVSIENNPSSRCRQFHQVQVFCDCSSRWEHHRQDPDIVTLLSLMLKTLLDCCNHDFSWNWFQKVWRSVRFVRHFCSGHNF